MSHPSDIFPNQSILDLSPAKSFSASQQLIHLVCQWEEQIGERGESERERWRERERERERESEAPVSEIKQWSAKAHCREGTS